MTMQETFPKTLHDFENKIQNFDAYSDGNDDNDVKIEVEDLDLFINKIPVNLENASLTANCSVRQIQSAHDLSQERGRQRRERMTEKMAPRTPRNTRRISTSSEESISLSQVIAGHVGRHAIVSQPMNCKVGQLMDGQRRNIGAAARQESMPASLPALAPSSPLSVPAMPEQEMGSLIFVLINRKIWKRNLKFRDSSVIAENEARRRWNVTECINHPENAALVDYLCQYILAQPCARDFWLIDNEMGHEVGFLSEISFLYLLQKDVMSHSESDMKDMNVETLNHFVEIVDFVAVQTCSDKSMLKSRARMPRLQLGEKNDVVSRHLISSLSPWAIKQ
ncbi:hypothetical protein J3Q64DRAFT_1836400 [Phycomyces blakesleeanus]|uniref:Uncharacterized protein n=1 Tax=Phycomyces blakesleeanus TaxID=4837 RepID=A0ABR3AW52_PHYBL